MQSRQKTSISVLRREMGLTVPEFAALIYRAPSTVNSLESGRLKLSDGAAYQIHLETGCSLRWLLDVDARGRPHFPTKDDDFKKPWSKETFELIQARAMKEQPLERYSAEAQQTRAAQVVAGWTSIHAAALKAGKAPLAEYRMRQFLNSQAKQFPPDIAKPDASTVANRPHTDRTRIAA